MKLHLFLFAKIALSLIFITGGFAQTTDDLKDATTEDLQLFFQSRTFEDLLNLKNDSSLTISIYSAWLAGEDQIDRARSKDSRNYMPMYAPTELFYSQQAQIRSEFIGFLSGRLFTGIPEWWHDAILSCPSYQNCFMSGNRRLKSYGFLKTLGLSHRKNIKIDFFSKNTIRGSFREQIDSEFSVGFEEDPELDLEIKEDLELMLPSFDIILVPDGRFVYVFSDGDNRESNIYCCDISGKILWRNKSGHQDDIGGNIEIDHLLVQLKMHENRIVLFSGSTTDTYLDILDLESGKILERFSVNRAARVAKNGGNG